MKYRIGTYTSYCITAAAGGAVLGSVGGSVGAITGAIMGIILVALARKADKALRDGIGAIDLEDIE